VKFLQTFERFDKVAFHGYQMTPQQMGLPDCSVEWQSPDQDTGCPLFSSEEKVTDEDMKKAKSYLNEEDIITIIGYSRGAAILLKALSEGAKAPENMFLVAPSWKRKWAIVEPKPLKIKAYIIHGGKDALVPLKHSVMLSMKTGYPLYVYPECNHINILKFKDNINSGIQIKNLKQAEKSLPDWGDQNKGTADEIESQYEFCKLLI
jgi:predicted alpha/beta hydrolase family esterase